jgi:hypothetical protein
MHINYFTCHLLPPLTTFTTLELLFVILPLYANLIGDKFVTSSFDKRFYYFIDILGSYCK